MRRLVVASGFKGLIRRLGLDDPVRAPKVDRGEVITDSGSSRVLRLEGFYLKVYRYYRLRPMVASIWARCRAQREYEALRFLRDQGLPGVEPVAWGSDRVAFRILRSCFVVTRAVDGARRLDALEAEPAAERRAIGRRLAAVVRRMHAAGFIDGDLHFRNLLVTSDAAGSPELHLIDHPRSRWGCSAAALRRGMVWDLACLDLDAATVASRAERLGFFKRYRDRAHLDSADRALLRDVERRRRRLAERRERKLERRRRDAASGRRGRRAWD